MSLKIAGEIKFKKYNTLSLCDSKHYSVTTECQGVLEKSLGKRKKFRTGIIWGFSTRKSWGISRGKRSGI